jgi:ATP-dependent Lon protease
MKHIKIVDPQKLRVKVEELKNRSDDIKARMGPILKALWFPERLLLEVNADINFDVLDLAFPHFAEVTNFYKRQILISQKLNTHFKSPPVLLLGEPGLGKTLYATHFAKLLKLSWYEISVATTTASFELSGSSLHWGEGAPGLIAEALAKSNVANPVFVIDEIDKISGSTHYSPLNIFYCLLEPHTASRFKDEALGFEMDASHVVWILTANNLVDIKGPILSRMKVFTIKKPDKAKMHGVIKSVLASLLKSDGLESLISSEVTDDIIDHLSDLTPRQIRLLLQEATIKAIMDDRHRILIEDIPEISHEQEVWRVGFI